MMNKAIGDRVSIREVYNLLNEFRTEIKNEIMPPLNQLRDSFIQLEQGRLTHLEQKFGVVETDIGIIKAGIDGQDKGINKIIVYAGIILSMVLGVVGLFLKIK